MPRAGHAAGAGHLQRVAAAGLAAGLGPEEHIRRLEVTVDNAGLQTPGPQQSARPPECSHPASTRRAASPSVPAGLVVQELQPEAEVPTQLLPSPGKCAQAAVFGHLAQRPPVRQLHGQVVPTVLPYDYGVR